MKQELELFNIDLGTFNSETKSFTPSDNIESFMWLDNSNCNNPSLMGALEIVPKEHSCEWPIYLWYSDENNRIVISGGLSFSNRRREYYIS